MKVSAILLRREDGYKRNYFDFQFDFWHLTCISIRFLSPGKNSSELSHSYFHQAFQTSIYPQPAPESLNESPAAPLSRQERDNLNHLARNLEDPSVEGEDGLQEGDYSQF